MKKLLVLGGGLNQLPLIKAAKEAGLYVIVCDYNHEPPGAKLCDKFYEKNAGDRDVILKIAEEEHIDGIIANTEALMANVAFISEKLGLVGNSEKSVMNLISKSRFRDLQRASGLYAPQHLETDDLAQALEAIAGFTYPIVVKPGENSGSRGTTVIHGKEEQEKLQAAFHLCKELSRNRRVVVEEYIESMALEDVEAEVFVHQGHILWDGLLLTLRTEQLPLIPMTAVYPFPYTDDRLTRTKAALEKAISAAGIVHGEYNAELFFTKDDRLFILEINARQGGDAIPEYVHKSSGVDFSKLLVTTAVGDNTYWDSLKTYPREIRYISYHPLFPTKTGTFVGLDIDPRVKDYVTKIDLCIQPGEPVQAAENAAFEIGYVELVFPNQEAQMGLSRQLCDLIRIVVE